MSMQYGDGHKNNLKQNKVKTIIERFNNTREIVIIEICKR